MMGCKQIKSLIDEAERPNLLPYEAAGHVAACPSCQVFASDRETLRELLAAGARVSAPLNFDAMLQDRLQQRKAGGSPSWFVPATYLRLGAVTAGLLVVVLVAQYGGVFNGPKPRGTYTPLEGPVAVAQPDLKVRAPIQPVGNATPVSTKAAQSQMLRWIKTPRGGAIVARSTPESGVMIADHQVVIVRGPKGDQVIPMQTVSMGAQPLLYGNGARPTAARPVLSSF